MRLLGTNLPLHSSPSCVFQTNRYSFDIRMKTVSLSTRNFPFRWSHWPRGVRNGSTAAYYLGLWVRIMPAAWMSVSVSVVCCQVLASVTGRSLVHMSPTECIVSECDREASITGRSWPTGGCYAMEKNKFQVKLSLKMTKMSEGFCQHISLPSC
jgi:hypothetical protein